MLGWKQSLFEIAVTIILLNIFATYYHVTAKRKGIRFGVSEIDRIASSEPLFKLF